MNDNFTRRGLAILVALWIAIAVGLFLFWAVKMKQEPPTVSLFAVNIRNPEATVTATGPGDTLTISAYATLTGPADSVKLMIADSGGTAHFKPDTTVWRSPVPNKLNVLRVIVASPPYTVGTRYVIRFRWLPYTNIAGSMTVAYASFVPQAPPPPNPGTITADSVKVVPSSWQGWPGDTLKPLVTTYLSNKSRIIQDCRAVAGIKPGRHYLVANPHGYPSTVPLRPAVDTLWLNILPAGINEPAGYTSFARSNGDTLPLPYPKKVIVKPEWQGAWSQYPVPDPDLTLTTDTDTGRFRVLSYVVNCV